jgi:hypothetical protein
VDRTESGVDNLDDQNESGGPLHFTCPRCQVDVLADFYGPCDDCRSALRATQGLESDGSPGVGGFEPKMNVTPNAVATKD